MEEQKLKLGINEKITGSTSKKKSVEMSGWGWVSKEITWNDTIPARVVVKNAITPFTLKQQSKGHRTIENIENYHSVMLDWDNGKISLEEMKNYVENLSYTCLLFTSRNHLKETDKGCNERFRLWIPLKKSISKEQYENLGKVLLNQFKDTYLDETCFDVARFFNPSNGNMIHYFNKGEFLDAFEIIRPEITPLQEVNLKKIKKTADKKEVFSEDDYVVLPDGTQKKIKEIKTHTRIICSFCDPSQRTSPDAHNAFLNINSKGVYYQRCSSEKLTRWQNPEEVDTTNWEVFWEDNLDMVVRLNDLNSKRRKSVIKPMKGQEAWVKFCIDNEMDVNSKMYLKRYSLVFDPKIPYGANPDTKEFNTYMESELIIYGREHPIQGDVNMDYLKNHCPVISKILWNVFADNETVEYFLNWIFYIIREKRKVHTMWVISTAMGAGKNSLSSLILKPLIGTRHFLEVPAQRLKPIFNSIEAQVLLKVVDEVFVKGQEATNKRNQAYVKNDVSSNERVLEFKGVDSIVVDNYLSYILFSNEGTLSWLLEGRDRRSNISINPDSIDIRLEDWFKKLGNTGYENAISSELKEFARYMMAFKLDDYNANNPLENTAKLKMQLASRSSEQDFYFYLKNEDWDKLGIMEYKFTETVKDIVNIYNKVIPILSKELYETCEAYHGIPQQVYSQLLKEWFGNRANQARKELNEMGVKLIDTTLSNNRVKYYKVK